MGNKNNYSAKFNNYIQKHLFMITSLISILNKTQTLNHKSIVTVIIEVFSKTEWVGKTLIDCRTVQFAYKQF